MVLLKNKLSWQNERDRYTNVRPIIINLKWEYHEKKTQNTISKTRIIQS